MDPKDVFIGRAKKYNCYSEAVCTPGRRCKDVMAGLARLAKNEKVVELSAYKIDKLLIKLVVMCHGRLNSGYGNKALLCGSVTINRGFFAHCTSDSANDIIRYLNRRGPGKVQLDSPIETIMEMEAAPCQD